MHKFNLQDSDNSYTFRLSKDVIIRL